MNWDQQLNILDSDIKVVNVKQDVHDDDVKNVSKREVVDSENMQNGGLVADDDIITTIASIEEATTEVPLVDDVSEKVAKYIENNYWPSSNFLYD